MAWTAPRTWVAGEVVTAALLNTHLRDNLKAIGDPWTAYTPVWTAATTNPTLGNGSLTGSYIQAGELVLFKIRLAIGSTTTVGAGAYSFTVPVTANTSVDEAIGQGLIFDTSAGSRFGRIASLASATTVRLYAADTTGGAATQANPITVATGDTFTVSGAYEAA